MVAYFVGKNLKRIPSKFQGVDALLTIQQELEQAQIEIQIEIMEQEDILETAVDRIAFLKDQLIKISIQKFDNYSTRSERFWSSWRKDLV